MKNAFVLLVCLLSFAQAITAQDKDVKLAEVYADMGEYEKAIETYKKSYNELNEYQLYDLGELYSITDNIEKAIETYHFLITQYPDFQKAYLPLAHSLRKNGEYARAMKYYEVYGNFDPNVSQHYINSMRWAEKQRKESDMVANRETLSLNTEYFDGFPIEYNKNVIYASNRNDIQRSVNNEDKNTTQLFKTHHSDENNFGFPSFLLKDLQQWQSMATIATHPSSNEIIFTKISQSSIIQQFRSQDKGMKLYTAELINGELKSLKALPFNSIKYNTAGATYSEDGNTIFFMSNQSGGYGGYDIYSSTRNSDGNWSDPVNLGSNINSPGDEILPQVINEKVVYASNWLTGFGGYDLFASQFNHAAMQWSEPENLGLGLNTRRDEYALVEVSDKYYLTAMTDNESANLYAVDNIQSFKSQPQLVKASYKEESIDMSDDFKQAFANESSASTSSSENTRKSKTDLPVMTSLNESLSPAERSAIQENEQNKIKKLFSVQVAVVDKSNTKKLSRYGDALSDIDAVYKIYFPDVIKVRVGSYDNKQRAQRTLNIIKSRGYNDAFIVVEQVIYSSNNEKSKSEEPSQRKETKTIEKNDVDNKKGKTSSLNKYKDIKTLPIGDGKYKVRLATYSQPKWFSADKVREFGNIQRIDREEWTIYLIGDYNTTTEAEYIMKKVKEKGFSEAQVVELIDGVPHRVD